MRQHLGRREREARKRRQSRGKHLSSHWDCFGGVTLKLGRKKSMETGNKTSVQLKKKFPGCVVDAER